VDVILLAGGYATRLYPLTKDRPKALLPVGGRPILDRVMDVLAQAEELRAFFLVSNARFAGHFRDWARTRTWKRPIEIVDDGTTCNEDRLGAIGDVQFVLDHANVDTEEGLFVMGTDNLAHFDILEVVRCSRGRGATCVFASRVGDPIRLKRMGNVVLDDDDRVVDFIEKPEEPKSDRAVPPFYAYSHESVGMIAQYLAEGNNSDAPGHFIEWLYRRVPVFACRTEGTVLDIGTVESYEAACREYEGR
jgi:glucose-1-phosphate thymidylyltransferase